MIVLFRKNLHGPLRPAPFADVTGEGAAPAPVLTEAAAVTLPLIGEPDLPAVAAILAAKFGDRFDVLETLAIGGMATLVQLRHRLMGGLFVAKVLHATLAADAEMRAAFRREARHVAQVSGHPAAVPIFEFLEGNDFACMLMPYIAGEDLDQLLARVGKFPREEALMLAAQITSMLLFAESLGILHCDLAPANIRLDPFGQYRLFDFGLSRSMTEGAGAAITLAGTPAYNSPERIRGSVPDIRGDLYALGLILIEVLSGRPAFEAPSLGQLAQKHLSGDLRIPTEVEKDRPIAFLIRKLVALKPEDRIGSAQELANSLTSFGYELPSFARPLGALGHPLGHPPPAAGLPKQAAEAPTPPPAPMPLIDPPKARRHRLEPNAR